MDNKNEEIEIDLKELFFVLRGKIVIIILTMLVFGVGGGLASHYLVTPMYSSTSGVYVLTNETVLSYADLQIGNSITNDYIQMIQSRTVLETVIKNLHMEDQLDYKQFRSCISVSNPTDTRILNITVTYEDPRIAKTLVDELANVAIDRISLIMDTKEPNIFETGSINNIPVGRSAKKTAVIAAFIGAVLSCGLFIVLHLMDDTIHTPEDIEKYLGLNTLASIPVDEEERNKKQKRFGLFSKKNKKKSSNK